MPDKALVLGGGGVTGIAWMTGVLAGLEESGIDLLASDLILGTSAGATVAAQITSPVGSAALFQRQTDPAQQIAELAPAPHLLDDLIGVLPGLLQIADPLERGRQAGRLACGADTVGEPVRRAVIERRLPSHDWPAKPLSIVAVDTLSGEPVRFDRYSGVSLVDAVAASCAVPGIWPPVTIDGRRLMDGGIRSAENADFATGFSRVLIISPLGMAASAGAGSGLAGQTQALRQSGGDLRVIQPDEASRSAIGPNPFDASMRAAAAIAGRAQARAIAPDVAAFWRRVP